MRFSNCFLVLNLFAGTVSAQSELKSLEVFSITEYQDGYFIVAVDQAKSDTTYIISEKYEGRLGKKFVRITPGLTYRFELIDILATSAAHPTELTVMRIRSTVVWRHGSRLKAPVLCKNLKGNWIAK